jgi:hypothetical protein
MSLLETICIGTKKAIEDRPRKAIDHLKQDMWNVAADGKTKVDHYNWIENFNLSQQDIDKVVKYFTDEGIKVRLWLTYTSKPTITLDWSGGMPVPCAQCGQFHENE